MANNQQNRLMRLANQLLQVNQTDIQALTATVQALTGQFGAPNWDNGAAAVWYQNAVGAPINAWAGAANVNNFKHIFLTRFHMPAMLEMWRTELNQCQQQPGESVNEYAFCKTFWGSDLSYCDQSCERMRACFMIWKIPTAELYQSEHLRDIKLITALTNQVAELEKNIINARSTVSRPPRNDSCNTTTTAEMLNQNRSIVYYSYGEAGHVSIYCPHKDDSNINATAATTPIAPTTTTATPIVNNIQSLVQELLRQLNGASSTLIYHQTKKVDPYPITDADVAKAKKSRPISNTITDLDIVPPSPFLQQTDSFTQNIVHSDLVESMDTETTIQPEAHSTTTKATVHTTKLTANAKSNVTNTTSNISPKKKKTVIKKKKKTNMQPLIFMYVLPYLMVNDIKN
ncbi:hypothetical protein RCL_jg1545.t1 [Rhizophagus clarus]|uniref:Retrotransposon gag domain-containing protein n=1 Tax=Rhizophagus clarus TaxID=94130 RepID=A0A8H3L521_9GLOM|nr:hypothetical protein RCL_jg1545.t1 [Rhizophagus clarus]